MTGMQRVSSEFIIPVVAASRIPARPRYYWLFAAWMSAGAAVAAVAGTALGILAAMEVSIGADRWTQSVQAHGRLQLFGFIAPFVVTLLLEFLPRLNGSRVIATRERFVVPGLLAFGAVTAAAGTIAGDGKPVIAVAGAAVFAAGAIGAVIVTWRQRPSVPVSIDPQPLFLRAATVWLVVAALLSLWFTGSAEAGVAELDGSRATVEVFLRGFVMLVIVGVGLRVFVGHLGLRPLDRGRQRVVLVALNASLAAWLAGQGLGPLPEMTVLARVGDFGFALTFLVFTSWLGIMPSLRRGGRREVYEVLVPVAWAAAILYAVTIGLLAVTGYDDLSLYQQGAIRHTLLLGFIVPLMVAVAQVVLARFGTGRVEWQPALTLAFILLVAAWPMRVVPAALGDSPGSVSQGFLGLAGLLTIASLGLVAGVCGRTAVVCART